MTATIQVLLKTGTGLEGVAIEELAWKCPGFSSHPRPAGMAGFVAIDVPSDKASDVQAIIKRLRCFESVDVVLHESTPAPGWLASKPRAEAVLRSCFSAMFSALRDPSIAAATGEDRRGPFELAVPVPGFLRRRGFSQAQLQAIGTREARAAGTTIVMKRKGTTRIHVKSFPDMLLGLLRVPAHPGNLKLARVHPTGVFPNYAFGLLHHAFTALVTTMQGRHLDGPLVVVDLMAGAGTIPAMLVRDAPYFSKWFPWRRFIVVAIEKDASFHEMTRENLEHVEIDPQLVDRLEIRHDDFSSVDLSFVDVIATQPPYGYSMPVPDDELSRLHEALFDAAGKWLRPGGVLTLITPRDDIVVPVAERGGWTNMATTRVKEHGITSSLHAFTRTSSSSP